MDEILNLNLEFDEKIGYYVSSRIIAKGLGKEHKHVLESLDNIRENNRAEISTLLIESEYKAKNGKMNREYKLTKDGFTLYMFHVQGFTEFKMAYINRFNEMESFIKEAHTKLKEITIDKKFDWMIKRMRDRIDKAEYIENQIAYLFDLLKEEYTKIMLDSECKTKSAATFFHDFKTPEKYDASKEPLPIIVELEIEKENLDKINELGLDRNKVLENTVKILGQQKLSNKE
ncbi:Rha family transcriptional regulator [Fusobacterium ulcerans]|uniref:Rha family transcriptional regulator n=1 Tax=Fusobacterium ulcerans TaxID=861 RepID=UPI0027B8BDFB|nr:Rha family transcriptional regulator [Fusobacterium ulcerans]